MHAHLENEMKGRDGYDTRMPAISGNHAVEIPLRIIRDVIVKYWEEAGRVCDWPRSGRFRTSNTKVSF